MIEDLSLLQISFEVLHEDLVFGVIGTAFFEDERALTDLVIAHI